MSRTDPETIIATWRCRLKAVRYCWDRETVTPHLPEACKFRWRRSSGLAQCQTSLRTRQHTRLRLFPNHSPRPHVQGRTRMMIDRELEPRYSHIVAFRYSSQKRKL